MFNVFCTLIVNDTRNHNGQNVLDLWGISPQQILTTVIIRIIVDKSTDHTKPHSICFFHKIKDNKRNLDKSLSRFVDNWKHRLELESAHVLHYANGLMCQTFLSEKLLQTCSTCRKKKKKMFGKIVMTCTHCR